MIKNSLSICIIMGLVVLTIPAEAKLMGGEQFPQTIQNYIDSIVHISMSKYNVPGCVITIVTDSSEVISSGYGYADQENDILVNANKTLFRIASISKTFTALAILQLVDEGKLDLQKDIRHYLPDDEFNFLVGLPIT